MALINGKKTFFVLNFSRSIIFRHKILFFLLLSPTSLFLPLWSCCQAFVTVLTWLFEKLKIFSKDILHD